MDEINYYAWANNLQTIRRNLFLSDDDENLDQKTEIFVDNNYQSLVDDSSDIKPNVKRDIILEDVSDADTIDFASDIEFIKKISQHPRDRLKRKIKRKKIKQEKTRTKKANKKQAIKD